MPAHPQIDLLIPLAKHKLAGLDLERQLLCTMLQLIWFRGRELGVQHPAHTTQLPQVGGKAAVCKLHSAHTDVCPKGALIAGTSAGILGQSLYFTAGSERGSHLVTLCWAFCRGLWLMRKNSANYGLRKPT